jgi:hypothetical protein
MLSRRRFLGSTLGAGPFLTEEDKDWVMGRALLARVGWSA